MTDPPTPTPSDADEGPSGPRRVWSLLWQPTVLKLLAAVMLAVPLAGIAWHLVLYLKFGDEAISAYLRSAWLKAFVFVAFVNLLGNWFHHRRTRMKIDLVSRIATYAWVLSMILLFRCVTDW